MLSSRRTSTPSSRTIRRVAAFVELPGPQGVIDAALSVKLASSRFAWFGGSAAARSARPLVRAISAVTKSGSRIAFFIVSYLLLQVVLTKTRWSDACYGKRQEATRVSRVSETGARAQAR